MADFDPNGVGIANGNIFGFPVREDEADIVIMPIPWDVTTSSFRSFYTTRFLSS
jgi:agmatinase